ncbi:MAG: T9SS type A sorting domain-containing protein [Bacteroidetes bacterium]|nr:T9SS type A sorting domain-containing protein [Bacteroidota bacterium]MBK8367630.1 T9SS type A sorting domain-containing protein [Bacteroidota bacterium]
MKKAVLLFFVSLPLLTNAQNLVPNPSFEDTLGCPQVYPDLDTKCKFWKSFRVTPDYINNCSSVCGYYNQAGYQQPNSGEAYAGFATYQTTIPDSREHIGVQLTTSLTIGTKYYISFYVSSAFNVQVNVATNKTGALLTTYDYTDNSGSIPLQNTCTFKTDSIIKDTVSWLKITGSFVADSAYQYLIIGNFFDDNNTDTLHLPDLGFGYYVSYYYLDDVCLTTDSLYAATWTGLHESILQNSFNIFPNPANEVVHLQSSQKIDYIEIYNPLGQRMYSKEISGLFNTEVSINDIPSGLYIFKIKSGRYYLSKIVNINH